jgi:integral membrane protein
MLRLPLLFLWIARLEGLSLLVLFFVAMPLKYGAGWEHATVPPGWAHGVLFVGYVAALGALATRERWSIVQVGLAFVAAFVPFGTFVFERRAQLERA